MEKSFKIYTYVDGTNDTLFPNAISPVEIFDFSYDAKTMGGAPSISASVKYPVCLDNVWTGKEYVTFNGEKYFIKQTPSSSLSNDDIRYKHDIEFVSERIILDNTYFFDVVTDPTDNDKYVSNSSKVDFYGDINEFAKRLDYSLKYSKVGYTVVVDAGVSSEAKMMSFEDQFFSQVLQSIFEVYEIAYYYVGKVIHIGFPTNAITHVFKQGANGTLLSINKTNANYKIINRITGVGSTDNIPYYYPNPSDDRAAIEAAGGTWITPSANLMPPIYRESKGAERFYNAKNKTYIDPETGEYYVFENEYVDGNPKEHKVTFDYIKPTIKETVNAAGLRIDMFDRFDYDTNDNDEVDSEGNYIHPYFFGRLRKFDGTNGFNLFEHAIDKGEMTISMTSGSCGGCNFTIMVDPDTQKNTVQVHANGELLRDKDGNVIVSGAPQRQQNNTKTDNVWIALKKDVETFGVIMPNATNNYRPTEKSDMFVILHIDLPQSYITTAENKLKEEIIKYLATNNTDKFNFSINLSRIFFAENPDVLSELNENSRVQLEYDSKRYEFYISSYSYKMSANEPLPQITIELTETLTINKGTLQTSIDSVKQDIMSSIGSVDFVKQGLKYFIRKDIKDYAKFVTFREGIDIANFESLLSGGTFRTDSEGKSYLEVDRLYVRLKAIFDNLEIKKTTYIGGEQISSLASMKCIKVEDREDIIDPETGEVTGENIWDYYRCYYLKDQEGTKIKNEFKVGDQAISRETNLASGSNIQNRYYWRLVVAIGDGYIDLSKDDRDPASDDAPIAGDDIVQLGNRDDVTRQKAIIQSTVAEDAPSIKLLAGINSFSLEGKAIISQGFDGINKRAKFSVFGETYIGNADGSSFIKYTPENGVEINAKLSVGTTIGNGKTLIDAISDAEQNAIDTANENLTNYSAQVTRAVNDLQDQIDGAIESFFKEYDPTLTNEPANGWETDAEKERHGNDTFTNTLTGKSWRWVKTGTNWGWTPIADTATEKALAAAAKAQDTADGKRKVFVRQPLNSEDYDIGDLWVDATYSTLYSNDILRCKTAKKVNEAFNIAHWELASKYTDDAKAEQALNEIGGYSYLKKALEQPPTEIKNGLILSSLISLGYNPTRSGFVTQSGLNGIYDATKPGGGIAFWSGGAMKDIAEDYPLPWDDNTPPRPENPSLYATSIIRMDGTVYHAGGNFWIDLNGKVHCDPLSFFVGKDQVGKILTLFTPVETGSAPNQKVAGIRQNYPFEDGAGKGRLYIGSHIISEDKDGILHLTKKDGSPASFYVTGGLSSKGYAEGSGGGGEGGASALYQLLDVIPNTSGTGVDGAVDKSVLTFDGTAGKWKAAKGLDEAALGDYLTTNKYATQGWVSSQGYLTQHQSLANYVTLNTDQNITGIKTFVGNNFSFYHEDGFLNIVQKSSYTGGWTRGLNFKNDNDVQYAVIGGYGNVNTFNYVYIGQSYDSRWITFASTGVKSSVDLEATKFKKTGGTSAQFLKADGSVDSSTYLTTGTASNTYVKKAGDIMTGSLTVNQSIILIQDWVKFNIAGRGLYNVSGDARWYWDGSSWYSDKNIFAAGNITGTRLMSNVAQGTSPLVVTSTTRVENLNADLLDNYHASGIATANTVVIRDGNNYTYLKYINSSTNTDENGDLDQFIVTKPNDSFYRKYGRDYVRVRLNDFINNCKTLDLTSLDQNTYYPCSVTISAKEPTTINIFVSLNSGSKPSWSTHTSGFTMNLSWQVFGGGWGTTIIQRKIFNDYYSNTSNGIHPCGGIEQNAYASTEIVYLRGGAKYLYTISNSTSAIAINTNGYSWSSGSTTYSAPTISAPKKHPSLCYEASSMLGAYNIYANYLQISSISVDGTVTATTYKSGKSMFQDGQLELSGATPYIDFHYGSSTADYTHRIIAETADRLNITTGLQVNGILYGKGNLNIGSTMLSGVKPTTTNTITNVFNASTVLAMELYTVNKDSAQPLFRWANNISTGYTTRYSIGSVRAVGDGFGQLRLWVGNDDVGTTGNWFALNNNGVVSTSTTYFETSNTGFKTGNVVFGAKGSVAEISSATNHLLVSGYSDIHVNYTASGTGRTIPTKWYWHKGAANTWADFEIGALITHGNVTINGITSVNGNLDVVGDIGSTGGITSTRMLATLGGLDVTDNAMFNNDATFDGTTYFNDVMNINTAVTLNGDVALNGTIRGNSSSKIICDGIGISAGNKESGCIISGNPNSWSIVLDHNDIQARNNGAWSILYINDYGGDVSITNSSATYSAKILSTKASTAYNNGALTVGGGVGVGGSVYVRNNVVVNGAVTAKEPSTSDIRLKDNIRDFNASLILKEIGKPFTFEWNSLARGLNSNLSNEHQNFGVSAQRVKEVLPGFAFECYEGGYLGVKYERFMPIVMAAQLETMGEVEILKRRVKELEDEIKILKGGK